MKSFLILGLFLLTSVAFSQEINVKATRQHWAGGACCVTGTKYTVAIRGSLDSLNNTEFKYAMIDGNQFSINKPIDKNGEWEIYHYEFNISFDHTQEIIIDEKITEIDKNLVQENYLLINYKNQEIKIPIKEIEDLFYLAYP